MSVMMASITTKDGTRADIFRAGVTLVVEGVVKGWMGIVLHLSLPASSSSSDNCLDWCQKYYFMKLRLPMTSIKAGRRSNQLLIICGTRYVRLKSRGRDRRFRFRMISSR
jgi:hypothetical protein